MLAQCVAQCNVSPLEFRLGVPGGVERWASLATNWSSMFASRAFASRFATSSTRPRSSGGSFDSIASVSLLNFMRSQAQRPG